VHILSSNSYTPGEIIYSEKGEHNTNLYLINSGEGIIISLYFNCLIFWILNQ